MGWIEERGSVRYKGRMWHFALRPKPQFNHGAWLAVQNSRLLAAKNWLESFCPGIIGCAIGKLVHNTHGKWLSPSGFKPFRFDILHQLRMHLHQNAILRPHGLEKQLLTWPQHRMRFLPLSKQRIGLSLRHQRGTSFPPQHWPHKFSLFTAGRDGSKGGQRVAGARCFEPLQNSPAYCLVPANLPKAPCLLENLFQLHLPSAAGEYSCALPFIAGTTEEPCVYSSGKPKPL